MNIFKSMTTSLTESLGQHDIERDVLKAPGFKSQGILTVEYTSEGKSQPVALGNVLPVGDVQYKPQVSFTLHPESGAEIKPGDQFALILTDPDAPSRTEKKWSEYCHWIVSGLTLTPTSNAKIESKEAPVESISTLLDLSKGSNLISYMGPAPPPGTGKHRYVFLFLKVNQGVTLEAPKDRPNWGTGVPASGFHEWFAGKGEIWGVNFFNAENTKKE
ncbi:hypothetical protein BABINDRAFT_155140 [Babjeviella inositovora NRRL Y-12698]|uniref:Phosphatidylethanolamine-binding protein n=1 Tax=Babjeviella inositovora NRRL Y-12698 TaxID=984486 RepID=A0A1E3QMS2_9ASCO|nr:uncharacterized protein BABINDRAFT_155140 [Babjeviella inositovora NRRL Y-12698]ODQ78930.1 hypothetical protein BABINDRAFT_155140 [Babjeviella inositovora NRRL Y-12698]